MHCLRFRIPGHESISEAAIRILRNALMTATGGQIPGHESISEAAIRILRNALMSTKIVYEQMDQNHCAHESIDEDHLNHVWPAGHWYRQREAPPAAHAVPPCGHTVMTLLTT